MSDIFSIYKIKYMHVFLQINTYIRSELPDVFLKQFVLQRISKIRLIYIYIYQHKKELLHLSTSLFLCLFSSKACTFFRILLEKFFPLLLRDFPCVAITLTNYKFISNCREHRKGHNQI